MRENYVSNSCRRTKARETGRKFFSVQAAQIAIVVFSTESNKGGDTRMGLRTSR